MHFFVRAVVVATLYCFLVVAKSDHLSKDEQSPKPHTNNSSPIAPIVLNVFYEGQCSQSALFFIRQLRPTAEALSDYIHVHLVPYGFAQATRIGNDVSFLCHHGESECLLNKIHACAFSRMKGMNLEKVQMATCLFEYSTTPMDGGKTCSNKFGLNWAEIKSCAKDDEGAKLKDKFGNETDSLEPPLPFVPYTILNKYGGSVKFQNNLKDRLKEMVCILLAKRSVTPKACK